MMVSLDELCGGSTRQNKNPQGKPAAVGIIGSKLDHVEIEDDEYD